MNKIKVWILNRKFFKDVIGDMRDDARSEFDFMKEKLYQKAFADARKDLEETLVYDIDTKATELSNKKMNDLLSVVDITKIVTVDKTRGMVYVGGIQADAGKLSNLKAEAEFFVQSELWHLIYETPKELAQRSMFVNGETLADMSKGKSMLYTLSTQKNIVETFKSYVPKVTPTNIPPKTP